MKITIAYASAGAGHQKIAEAIAHYFKENCKDIDIEEIDILDKLSPLFKAIYRLGYPFLVNHAPWLWRFCFWITYIKPLRGLVSFIALTNDRLNTKEFSRYLIERNPDYIISTHFLPPEISAYLKRKSKINSRIITVITDFGVHPYWVHEATDLYIAASQYTKERLVSQGVGPEKIRIFGIPVDEKFLKTQPKDELLRKLELKKDMFTVLLITGSFGIGPIKEIVGVLYRDVQVIVVTARNKNLCNELKSRNYPHVRVFGFVDNVQELMGVADLIITKPGGSTMAEVLAVGLPPVFICAIPGQETENIKALMSFGIGKNTCNPQEVKSIVLDYKAHPEKLLEVKDKIIRFRKCNTAQELCYEVCQGSVRACS